MAAAFTAFTLPSAMAMAALGLFLAGSGLVAEGAPVLLGLKAAAVAVVANALLGMAGSLAATRATATIAAISAILVLILPERTTAQLLVIVLGGLAGLGLAMAPALSARSASRRPPSTAAPGRAQSVTVMSATRRARVVALVAAVLFVGLLAVLPILAHLGPAADLFDRIYRAGALVFGGGHVVLPLLQAEVGPLVDTSEFLAGYGAAQAVPGPLFTIAAYLGAVAQPFGGVGGAVVALVAIFLPGALLVLAVMPFWERIARVGWTRGVLTGVNAAVVGLLGAAFYDPVFLRGAATVPALCLAIAAFAALRFWSAPPWAVVIASGAVGAAVL